MSDGAFEYCTVAQQGEQGSAETPPELCYTAIEEATKKFDLRAPQAMDVVCSDVPR
jgi:hypothetical protein